MNKILAVALLASVPFSAAQAHDTQTGIGAEVRQELAEARKEVRVELAKAKRDLDTEPLTLGDNFSFGKHGKADPRLPRAEITAQGDFLIEGKAQTVDAVQRRQLLAYRGQVIGIAKTGIDLGQRSADAALEATRRATRDFIRRPGIGAVADGDIHAVTRQRQRDGPADAPRCARDEGSLACKTQHAVLPRFR